MAFFSYCIPPSQTIQVQSNHERDLIICDHYSLALSLFLARFRFNLYMLPLSDPIETTILEAFQPGKDLLHTKPDLDKITPDVIKIIFTTYDFSTTLYNYEPIQGGRLPTNVEMLKGDIKTLNDNCIDILSKYASSGDPKLIQSIEVMRNRTDNLLGPFGISNLSKPNKHEIADLIELFELLLSSYKTIDEIKSRTENTD